MVLAAMSQAVKRDSWSIFLKPLDTNSWVAFIATTTALVLAAQLLLFIRYLQGKHAKTKTAKKIAKVLIFFAWVCFVLTFCFYRGVLTMFFSTEVDIPFRTMKDVIKKYPKWKLMIRSGVQPLIRRHVQAGEPEFLKFWDRIQYKSDETVFSDIEEVITRHDKNAVVICVHESLLDMHRKYGKPEDRDKLEIFQRGPFEPFGMVVI